MTPAGRAPVVLALALTLATFRASAQESAPPLTLGDVALIANAPASEGADLLGRALLDPDPRVRLVAARVIGSTGRAGLSTPMIGALARERDPAVGAELVRDLLYVGKTAAIDIVKPQVRRLGEAAALAYAEWLARVEPDRFIAALPELLASSGKRSGQLADLASIAARNHDKADAVRRAWMAVTPDRGWTAFLEAAFHPPTEIDTAASVFEEALRSPRPAVREETVWFVIAALSNERRVPASVLDAALPGDYPGQSRWEAFGRDLIARQQGKAKSVDASELLKSEGDDHYDRVSALRGLRELTGAERAEVTARVGERRRGPNFTPTTAGTRTMPVLAPGLISSTLERAGCHPRTAAAAGITELTYGADGRVSKLAFDPGGLTASCQMALTALARLVVADVEDGSTESQMVILPMSPAFLACSMEPDAPPSDPPASVGGPGPIKAPSKLRDVKPEYPEGAIARRIQGVVVIGTTIATTGCMRSGRVVRSIPPLDVPALVAVMQWAYSPTLVNGQAVPVIMTVTVNFTLQ